MRFAKAMEYDVEKTNLAFAFRWTRLKHRELTSWKYRECIISPTRSAYQDSVTTFVNVPLETPESALTEFLNQAVKLLFEVFGGFALDKRVTEDLVRRLLERRI